MSSSGNPDDHPIVRSVRDAIDAVLVFESAMQTAEEDGGDPAKAALQTVVDKLQAMDKIAREHPDGQREVPEEILLNPTMDWDDVRIRQLEQAIQEHDKVRHQQRHMLDLAQLLEAAVGGSDSSASTAPPSSSSSSHPLGAAPAISASGTQASPPSATSSPPPPRQATAASHTQEHSR